MRFGPFPCAVALAFLAGCGGEPTPADTPAREAGYAMPDLGDPVDEERATAPPRAEPVGTEALAAAFERSCPDTRLREAICEPMEDATEYSCDYALEQDGARLSRVTAIARVRSGWALIDLPDHCLG